MIEQMEPYCRAFFCQAHVSSPPPCLSQNPRGPTGPTTLEQDGITKQLVHSPPTRCRLSVTTVSWYRTSVSAEATGKLPGIPTVSSNSTKCQVMPSAGAECLAHSGLCCKNLTLAAVEPDVCTETAIQRKAGC